MTEATTGAAAKAGHGYVTCGARKRQGDGTCTRPAGWGTDHAGTGTCKLHLGATANHRAAADHAQQVSALAKARETFGIALDVEPGDALLGLVRTSSGLCTWYSSRIEQLTGVTMGDKSHPLVAMFLDERKHLSAVAKAALDAGIAERRVRLEEEQGRLLVGLLERVIRRLDELVYRETGRRLLDPMDPQVRELVRVELAAIEGGEAA